MRFLFLLISFYFFQQSCVVGEKYFTAQPSKHRVKSNGLATNGCYVGVYTSPFHNEKGITVFIFYDNGLALRYWPIAYEKDSMNNEEWIKKKIRERITFQDGFFRRKEA